MDVQWAACSDKTARGYKVSTSGFQYGTVRGGVTGGSQKRAPKFNGKTLDVENRFFEDNKRIYKTFAAAADKAEKKEAPKKVAL